MEDITLQKLRVGIRKKHTYIPLHEEVRREEDKPLKGLRQQTKEARWFKVAFLKPQKPV